MERDEKITAVLNGCSHALDGAIRYIEILTGTDLYAIATLPKKSESLEFLEMHKNRANDLMIKITKGEEIK